MNRFTTILFFALLVFAGYKLYRQIEKQVKGVVQHEQQTNTQSQAGRSGLPPQLEASWQQAVKAGPAAMSNWLSAYSGSIHDPCRASLELDYCERVAWMNPTEAKRVFAAVKNRTGTNSPVYPRIKQLEAAFK